MAYGKQKMLGLLMALAPSRNSCFWTSPPPGSSGKSGRRSTASSPMRRNSLGCGIMVVEHDMELVRRLCPHILVLESGRLLAQGAPAEVLTRRDVIDAYIGSDEE